MTSKTHVRSSSGSSNENHSCWSSIAPCTLGGYVGGVEHARRSIFAPRSPPTGCAPSRSSSRSTAATRRCSWAHAAVVCFPLSTAEVQACVRVARRARPAVRRPRLRHRARRRRGAARRPGRHRHDEDEPGPLGRRRRHASRGSSPACSTSTSAAALSRAYGLHFAPDPSSQQSCSIGGNVANNSGGPHCLAVRRHQRPRAGVEVVLPDGAGRGARRPRPRAGGLRPARGVRRQRGHARHRHPHRRAAHAEPAGGAHAAARLHVGRRRRRDGRARSSPPASCPPRSR